MMAPLRRVFFDTNQLQINNKIFIVFVVIREVLKRTAAIKY